MTLAYPNRVTLERGHASIRGFPLTARCALEHYIRGGMEDMLLAEAGEVSTVVLQ